MDLVPAQLKPAKIEGKFSGRDKEKDVRTSNCLAAKGTVSLNLDIFFSVHISTIIDSCGGCCSYELGSKGNG